MDRSPENAPLQSDDSGSNDVDDVDMAEAGRPDAAEPPSALQNPSSADQLEHCGRWLLSIPRDDVVTLRQSPEYAEFISSFERLGQAHRKVVTRNRTFMDDDDDFSNSDESGRPPTPAQFSFLQHVASDDVVLRVFEFLECHALTRTSITCSRLYQLAQQSAKQRTMDVAGTRQLNNVMKLLRAKEQMNGVNVGVGEAHVRTPMLLLPRRVLVTEAGDPDYNGIYFCTGCNGNGFIFTKPRPAERRAQQQPGMPGAPPDDAQRFETEEDQPADFHRCIFAKRFSNETILWYLSKEVELTEADGALHPGQITQRFSFWSKLMSIGDASPDVCRYPSQTSVLARRDGGWRCLGETLDLRPPVVELLD